jgi:hypothetical protein
MSLTYYVALPFVRTEEGVAPGEAQEMPNEGAAIRRPESMARDPANGGALAFKRSGEPNLGNFGDDGCTLPRPRHVTDFGRCGGAPGLG